jgi:hypothetical protein
MPFGPSHQSVSNDFSFHPSTDLTAEIHDAVRQRMQESAHWILENVPEGIARTQCITKLREAMMWANAAIACDTNTLAHETDNS